MKLKVSIAEQVAELFDEHAALIRRYRVSTALNGPGELADSGCTPRGRHIVRAKIGQGLAPDAVLVGRRPTGERYSQALITAEPDRDWILGRILWLSGCEKGVNRLGNVDTMRRYIYVHGTPHESQLGQAVSHGCIRLSCADMMELFELLPVGSLVEITED